MARDALLNEVNFLSSRNACLEEEVSSLPEVKELLASTKLQNDLLLTLLGEKEEELEGVMADMKEVKLLYRHELDVLLEKVAPVYE
jgi:DNA-binding Lrp family transcriptional regulator